MKLNIDYDEENKIKGYYFERRNPFNNNIINLMYLTNVENDNYLKNQLKVLPKEVLDNCLLFERGTNKLKWFKKINLDKYIIAYIWKNELLKFVKLGFDNIIKSPNDAYDYCVWRKYDFKGNY